MRENKFKYYWQHDETGRIVSKIFTLIEIESGIVDAWNNKLSRYGEPFKRAEYTRLKDKNGVEIYEGDIIKHYDDFNFYINAVIYNQEIAMYALDSFPVDIIPKDCEVIGNKYENPELLEAKS